MWESLAFRIDATGGGMMVGAGSGPNAAGEEVSLDEWLSQRQLGSLKGPLEALGVEEVIDIEDLEQEDLAEVVEGCDPEVARGFMEAAEALQQAAGLGGGGDLPLP